MWAHYPEHYWIYMPQNNCFGIRIQLNIQKDKWNLWERHQNNKGPVFENCYLPTSCWGQVDLHTPDLWLSAYLPYAYNTWKYMKISYLRKIKLRCIRTTLTTAAYIDGFTQKLGIIWDFKSPSIVQYLDLLELIYLQHVCWILV